MFWVRTINSIAYSPSNETTHKLLTVIPSLEAISKELIRLTDGASDIKPTHKAALRLFSARVNISPAKLMLNFKNIALMKSIKTIKKRLYHLFYTVTQTEFLLNGSAINCRKCYSKLGSLDFFINYKKGKKYLAAANLRIIYFFQIPYHTTPASIFKLEKTLIKKGTVSEIRAR